MTDGGERIADFMRNRRGEPAHSSQFELLRPLLDRSNILEKDTNSSLVSARRACEARPQAQLRRCRADRRFRHRRQHGIEQLPRGFSSSSHFANACRKRLHVRIFRQRWPVNCASGCNDSNTRAARLFARTRVWASITSTPWSICAITSRLISS